VDILEKQANLWIMNPDGSNNIYNENSGNVGINTPNPRFQLDVSGDIGTSNINLPHNGNLLQQNATGTSYYSLLTPPGSVIAYLGAQIPSGWLFCDGSVYKPTDYPDLFAVINYVYGIDADENFAIPDFRGTFLRGADMNINTNFVDANQNQILMTGPTLNTPQLPFVAQHTHNFNDNYVSAAGGTGSSLPIVNKTSDTNGQLISTPNTTAINNPLDQFQYYYNLGDNPPANDNRPYNVGVNWLIKF
jgi:microcystin-dependent protein